MSKAALTVMYLASLPESPMNNDRSFDGALILIDLCAIISVLVIAIHVVTTGDWFSLLFGIGGASLLLLVCWALDQLVGRKFQ